MEKLTRLNAHGQKVHTTVAAMFFDKNEESILMIEKADPAYGNKYSIIAGHVEDNESIREAFKRELYEELGLEDVDFEIMKTFKELSDSCRYDVHVHDWHVFLVDYIPETNKVRFDKSEIKSLKWIKLADLPEFSKSLTSGAYSLFKAMKFI